MKKNKRPWLVRSILGVVSGIVHVLSFPPVRDYIWGKAIEKGEKKIVDVQAKVVGGGESELKKERRLFWKKKK